MKEPQAIDSPRQLPQLRTTRQQLAEMKHLVQRQLPQPGVADQMTFGIAVRSEWLSLGNGTHFRQPATMPEMSPDVGMSQRNEVEQQENSQQNQSCQDVDI